LVIDYGGGKLAFTLFKQDKSNSFKIIDQYIDFLCGELDLDLLIAKEVHKTLPEPKPKLKKDFIEKSHLMFSLLKECQKAKEK
jgi:molecular chaperone DnaK (HSP70)